MLFHHNDLMYYCQMFVDMMSAVICTDSELLFTLRLQSSFHIFKNIARQLPHGVETSIFVSEAISVDFDASEGQGCSLYIRGVDSATEQKKYIETLVIIRLASVVWLHKGRKRVSCSVPQTYIVTLNCLKVNRVFVVKFHIIVLICFLIVISPRKLVLPHSH